MAVDPRDPTTWIERDAYAAFCGDRSQRPLAHYDKAVEQRNPMAFSLNWLAVLLFPAWCGYRRQWPIWGGFVGLLVLVGAVEAVAGFTIPAGAFTGLGVVAGMLAHGLLLSVANQRHASLVDEGLAPEAIGDRLRDAAAPSVPGAVLGLVGALAVLVGGELLLGSLLG